MTGIRPATGVTAAADRGCSGRLLASTCIRRGASTGAACTFGLVLIGSSFNLVVGVVGWDRALMKSSATTALTTSRPVPVVPVRAGSTRNLAVSAAPVRVSALSPPPGARPTADMSRGQSGGRLFTFTVQPTTVVHLGLLLRPVTVRTNTLHAPLGSDTWVVLDASGTRIPLSEATRQDVFDATASWTDQAFADPGVDVPLR